MLYYAKHINTKIMPLRQKIMLPIIACSLYSFALPAQAQLEPRLPPPEDRPVLERHFEIDDRDAERVIREQEMIENSDMDRELYESEEMHAAPQMSEEDFDEIKERFQQPLDRRDMIEQIRQLAPEHQTEIRDIVQQLKDLQRAQDDLLENGIENEEAAAYARDLQTEMQDLKSGLKELHADLRNDPDFQVAASILQPAAETDCGIPECYAEEIDLSDDELDGLSDLESELAYREELIAQLLEQLDSDDNSTSSLEANLLAIENNPIASGGVAVFTIILLWLFRGRIAELSGFGVKVSFKTDKQEKTHSEHKNDSSRLSK